MGKVAAAHRQMARTFTGLPKATLAALEAEAPRIGDAELQAVGVAGWTFFGRYKLKVTAQLDAGRVTSFLNVKGSPPGPMSWASYGTVTHDVRRRKPGRRPRALHLPNGWRTGPLSVDGMTGRQAWPRIDKALEERLNELADQKADEVGDA